LTNSKKPLLNNNSSEGKTSSSMLILDYRQQPTVADREAFEQLKSSPPSAETHPNTFAWFTLVQRFNESVRSTWGGAAPAKGAAKPAAKH